MSRGRRLLVIRDDGIAEITLTYGKIALVDKEDAERCCQIGWTLKRWSGREYAHGSIGKHGNRKTVMLHTFLIKPGKGYTADHINGDGLDNRRCNLRLATPQENARNKRKIKQKTSKYKGVHKRENGKWRAAIRVNYKLINLGTFINEIDAAKTYNENALKFFGEYACLNQLP